MRPDNDRFRHAFNRRLCHRYRHRLVALSVCATAWASIAYARPSAGAPRTPRPMIDKTDVARDLFAGDWTLWGGPQASAFWMTSRVGTLWVCWRIQARSGRARRYSSELPPVYDPCWYPLELQSADAAPTRADEPFEEDAPDSSGEEGYDDPLDTRGDRMKSRSALVVGQSRQEIEHWRVYTLGPAAAIELVDPEGDVWRIGPASSQGEYTGRVQLAAGRPRPWFRTRSDRVGGDNRTRPPAETQLRIVCPPVSRARKIFRARARVRSSLVASWALRHTSGNSRRAADPRRRANAEQSWLVGAEFRFAGIDRRRSTQLQSSGPRELGTLRYARALDVDEDRVLRLLCRGAADS